MDARRSNALLRGKRPSSLTGWGPLFCFLNLFVYWAGNRDEVATGCTGGIKEIPDEFIVFEAGHHIEYFTATRADVDWTKVS